MESNKMEFMEIALTGTLAGDGTPFGEKTTGEYFEVEATDSSCATIDGESCIEHGEEVIVKSRYYGIWKSESTERMFISI